MAEILMWIGATLLMMGVSGAVFDGLVLGILTPTQKNPDRPGDQEARRFTRLSLKLEAASVGIGAAFLTTGIAAYLSV